MTHKDSIFSVIKIHYYFLKALGFFSLTINFSESGKFVLTTTWKDYTLFFISFWLHFRTAKMDYESKEFLKFEDSRIVQAGLSLSRFSSFINLGLIIVLRFVNRKKIAQIDVKKWRSDYWTPMCHRLREYINLINHIPILENLLHQNSSFLAFVNYKMRHKNDKNEII